MNSLVTCSLLNGGRIFGYYLLFKNRIILLNKEHIFKGSAKDLQLIWNTLQTILQIQNGMKLNNLKKLI